MGIIPINFQSLNPDSAQGINNQSVNATLPIESLPQGNLSAMGFNVVGNGTSQVVAANLTLVENPTATENLTGNLLANALGDNISIVSITIQSQSYSVGNLINLQGIGNLTINANGDYSLLVNNINFSGALPTIDFVVANSNQSDNATFSVFIDRLSTGGAFQANDDYVAISQGTNTTGNLLNNDNGENIFIESFTLSSLPGVTFLSGETAQIQVYQQNNYLNVASIKIMADGNYFLTALNSIFNGNLPLITYTLKNNLGAIDTAKLNITINTNLNPPVLPPSNSVDIPTQTPIDLPIPIVVPPIPEPLPILQPLTLTLNEDEQISYNLLGALFPNIQVDAFSVNGQNFATSNNSQSINGIGQIKILPNGSLTFSPIANYNGFVPTVWYRITNGFDEFSYTVDFTINPVFDINDDPFKNEIIYWGRGIPNNSVFSNAIITSTGYTYQAANSPVLEGNFSIEDDNNETQNFKRYIKLINNNSNFVSLKNFAFTNKSLTFEIYFKLTTLTQQISLWSGPNDRVAYINTDNSLSVTTGHNITETLNNVINLNEKIHLAITWHFNESSNKWDNIKVWINGIMQGDFTANIIRNTDNPPPYNPPMSYSNYLAFLALQNISIPDFPTFLHTLRIARSKMIIYHFKITKAERYTQNFNPLTESYLF